MKTEFLGKKQIPPEIPLRQAVAVSALAQAHARGVSQPRRVFDLVAAFNGSIDGMLVVVRRGGSPRLVSAEGFEPTSAVVIELDDLDAAVRSGAEVRP